MPKSKPKEAHLVPTLKARWFCKVLIVKCFPECAEGPYQDSPFPPEIGTRCEGTFEWKARLANAESSVCAPWRGKTCAVRPVLAGVVHVVLGNYFR